MNAYDEYLEFLTSTPTLEEIVDFEPSDDTLFRIEYLEEVHEAGKLTDEEMYELRECYKAEDFIQKLKIRARRKLHMEQTPY